MTVLFTPHNSVIRVGRPYVGFVGFVALAVLGAALYATTAPSWTEAGLRAELDRVFRAGVPREAVEHWFEVNRVRTLYFSGQRTSDLHGIIYAGPIADRSLAKFRVRIRFDRAGQVAGYEMEEESRN